MMNLIRNNKLVFFGLLLGAIAGYAYYYFIGCNSGTCAITSRPVNSTVYGAVMGALLVSSFKPNAKEKNQ